MRVFYLSYHDRAITGGHKYNDMFCEFLSKIGNVNIFFTPSCSGIYRSWRRIYAPFFELKWLKCLHAGDIVFYNDTSHKYHVLLALLVGLKRNIHPVVIIHHFQYLGEKGVSKYLNFCIQYIYYSFCKSIIVPSPFTFDLARKLFPRKDIYYIPLPFERKFTVSPVYEKGNLLYVGTIDERKGLKYLINALKYVAQKGLSFELNIVGKIVDQKYYDELLVQIKKTGLESKIHFLGRVSNEQLERCYQRAEIFVFPSLLEGYGIVLVEAMSKGLPIVAFDNSAMPYSIRDGENGLLARNKDSYSFAEKLMTVCGNSVMRRHLQKGMKETIDSLKTKKDFEEGISFFVNKIM